MIEPVLERWDTDPDTGSLRQDLLTLTLMMRDSTALPEGRALTAVATAGELRDLLRRTTERAIAPFHRAFDRAVARGEISAVADAYMMAHVIFHGVVGWEPRHGALPTDEECARMVSVVLGGRQGESHPR